jgi:hypothetical protein
MKSTKNTKSNKKNLALFAGAGLLLGSLGVMGLQVHAQQPLGQAANLQVAPSIVTTSSATVKDVAEANDVKDVKDVAEANDVKDTVDKDNIQVGNQTEGQDVSGANDLTANQQ